MDGGIGGTLYIIAARTATSTCVTSTGTTASGTGATTGLTTTGTPTIPRLCAQIVPLLSHLLGEFLFKELRVFANNANIVLIAQIIMNKYYITTAIDYVNAPPHVGHALEKVQADVLRYN